MAGDRDLETDNQSPVRSMAAYMAGQPRDVQILDSQAHDLSDLFPLRPLGGGVSVDVDGRRHGVFAQTQDDGTARLMLLSVDDARAALEEYARPILDEYKDQPFDGRDVWVNNETGEIDRSVEASQVWVSQDTWQVVGAEDGAGVDFSGKVQLSWIYDQAIEEAQAGADGARSLTRADFVTQSYTQEHENIPLIIPEGLEQARYIEKAVQEITTSAGAADFSFTSDQISADPAIEVYTTPQPQVAQAPAIKTEQEAAPVPQAADVPSTPPAATAEALAKTFEREAQEAKVDLSRYTIPEGTASLGEDPDGPAVTALNLELYEKAILIEGAVRGGTLSPDNLKSVIENFSGVEGSQDYVAALERLSNETPAPSIRADLSEAYKSFDGVYTQARTARVEENAAREQAQEAATDAAELDAARAQARAELGNIAVYEPVLDQGGQLIVVNLGDEGGLQGLFTQDGVPTLLGVQEIGEIAKDTPIERIKDIENAQVRLEMSLTHGFGVIAKGAGITQYAGELAKTDGSAHVHVDITGGGYADLNEDEIAARVHEAAKAGQIQSAPQEPAEESRQENGPVSHNTLSEPPVSTGNAPSV